jgi:hypothetical protein
MLAQLHPERLHLVGWIVLAAAPALADVISYEGTSFPEADGQGWEYTPFCDPERWLEDGRLFQHVEVGCGGPPGGDKDRYIRSLADFAGEQDFFIEFRMQTDGDQSEIPGVSPAVLAAAGLFGISYDFVIAKDLVRFQRDDFQVTVFVDVDPRAPHTYRLELYGEDRYAVFVDCEIIDEGIPGGQFPSNEFDVIAFRVQPWFLENTTQWDYVRLGTIPQPGSGDFDSEGDVDLRDFYFFDECLTNGGPGVEAGPGCLWADMDQDGDVDFHDFSLFQLAFTGSE